MQKEQKIRKVITRVEKRYKVETADSVEKKELVNFFKEAYSDQFNAADYQNGEEILKRWEWANLNNPNIYAKQFPAWVCKDNKTNRIVGHFGIIPVLLKFKNSCHPAAWGRELIVLPKFRKLGIGPFLVDTVLRNIKDKVVLFLIAGLSNHSYAIFKKFSFVDLRYIPLYVRINKPDKILQSKIRNRILARLLGIFAGVALKILYLFSYIRMSKYNTSENILITEIANFDDSFDKLWEKASICFPIIIKRNSVNLNWRFVHQPYWKYRIFKAESKEDREIKGYVVLREGKSRGLRVGIVSDLFAPADDIHTIASLINFTIKYFGKKRDLDLIRCDILNRRFEQILKNFGFISIRSNSHFMLTNIHQDLEFDFVTSPDQWFINYADCDLDLSGRR